ncbi:Uncharacterised protein [Mycobacteroides abscessus subsp. abscessus]|nr:Uncharacterised protein [Mycobacteroides abscessus subsp. abscessus]
MTGSSATCPWLLASRLGATVLTALRKYPKYDCRTVGREGRTGA